MIILGLTGSIGMGKTTAAENFRRQGVPVHDADRTVHELLAKNGEAVELIEKQFPGSEKKGAIDREKIAGEVFNDPEALARIESILHPMVRSQERSFLEIAARKGHRLAVLDVPLLFETGGETRCDAVVVVSAPGFLQELRVLSRPGMTRERLVSILARQISDAEKKQRADFVVLTGLGRDFGLLQILNIVRITRNWRGGHWPPMPNIRGQHLARSGP